MSDQLTLIEAADLYILHKVAVNDEIVAAAAFKAGAAWQKEQYTPLLQLISLLKSKWEDFDADALKIIYSNIFTECERLQD